MDIQNQPQLSQVLFFMHCTQLRKIILNLNNILNINQLEKEQLVDLPWSADMPAMSGNLPQKPWHRFAPAPGVHVSESQASPAINWPSTTLNILTFSDLHSHTHSRSVPPPPIQSTRGNCCTADKPKQRPLNLFTSDDCFMWRSDNAQLPVLLSLFNINVSEAIVEHFFLGLLNKRWWHHGMFVASLSSQDSWKFGQISDIRSFRWQEGFDKCGLKTSNYSGHTNLVE